MKVKSLVSKMLMLTVAGLLALNAVPAGTYAKGGSESLLTHLPAANQPAKLTDITVQGKPAADQTYPALQSQPKAPVFHHLTIDDGLTHNTVFHVLQDRQGFIWATTVEGINKYDGMTITNFTPQAAGSRSTPQFFQTMLEDRDGILWFCNYGAGLVRHDPVFNTWKYYQHDDNNPNSLANDTLWLLFEDRNGILWVSTFDGLSRFDPATEQFTNYFHDPNNENSLGGIVAGQVQQAADGTLWIGTFGGGLDKFDPTTETFTHYRNDPDNPDSLSDNNVGTIWMDPDGTIWVGTNNGLNHFDPVSGRAVRYLHDENDDASLSHNFVVHVMRDSRGQLWVSTWGGGLNRFDEQNQQFIRYRSDPHDPDSLSNDLALYFSEDRSGALWFGTIGGINRYDPAGQRFARYQHQPDNPSSLPAGRVREITQDKDGIFWIAMWDQGLVRFDREKNIYTRYQAEPDNPNSLSNDNIFDISYDPRGWLWVGTTAGLNKFDLSSERWTQYRANPGNPNVMATDWVSGVEVDANGHLWLAVYGEGLHRFDPISEIFTRYPHDPNNPNSMPVNYNLNYVKAVADGKLWIGGDASISLFDPATERAVNFSPEQHGISNLGSHQTHQDRHGSVWVSTFSGVNKYEPDSNRFTAYPEIGTVLADDAQGNLWVIAGKSLARFDPDTGSLRRYDEYDGLLSNAIEPTAGYTSPSGEIFVGGAKGFNSFFPDQMLDNPTPPQVVITEFELRNESVAIGGDSPLQKHINVTEKITLPYDYNALTLKFAALNYRAPQKNQYAYMLEGFDQDWMQTDSRNRHATYTNLDPGDYTFRVKASNNDGVWNEEGTALTIIITPPWWATWWFRSLAVLAAVGFAAAGYGYRMRNLRWRTVELERQVTERTQELAESNRQMQAAKEKAERANRAKSVFLANMSHELRTPLNAVLGFSQLMHNDRHATADQKQYLAIIGHSGEHLLNLIDNVLEISKIESGRVELEVTHIDLFQLLQEMKSLMGMRAHDKGLDFTLEQTPDLPRHIRADGGKLRQVLINLIGNAIKYTASGAVNLRAMAMEQNRSDPVRVRFEVEDTGPGIRKEERERIFSAFVQLGNRASTRAGTGLGLAISKQYVELMGGKLGVTGEPGKGSIFHFEITATMLPPEAIPAEPLRDRRVIGLTEGQPRHRLLIVEDHPETRLLLRRLLEPLGFDLREATTGEEAVAAFEQWRPDLIWMDIRMPVMDGLAATRRIKETGAGSRTKIIAVTAHALKEERREILAAGCDDFIRKPYRNADIYAALTRNLGLRFVYEEAEPSDNGELPLTAAGLADLPAELLKELEQALVRLDIDAVSRVIEAIRARHPSQAEELETVAQDLQFGRLLRFIRTTRGGTGDET